MDDELAAQLNNAWEQYPGGNTVAFIGRVTSGKTVAMAMLKYTMTEYWDPEKTGIYATVTKGYDTVNRMLEGMKGGAYPDVTLKGEKNEIRITLQNVNGNTDDWEIIVDDMSGEDVVDLLSSDKYETSEARLSHILETGMAHLLFATKYVIMIDCEKMSSWDVDGGSMAAAIKNLVSMKKIMPPECPRGIIAAVVFTKADKLPAEHTNTSSGDLLKLYKEFMHSLKMNDIEFKTFKSYVGSSMSVMHYSVKDDCKDDGAWRAQMEATIASRISKAEDNARRKGLDERAIMNTRAQIRAQVEKEYARRSRMPPAPDTSGPRITYPFRYPDAEYSALISWMIDRKNGGRR
ncbi:MAG: hypothetical protein MPK62_02400 [Alphaproteobacteria bacterium]|nr:hypothetical protein [Alphaproteobacteria bacterium]